MLELPMCRREEEQEDAGMESSLVGEGDMVQGVGEDCPLLLQGLSHPNLHPLGTWGGWHLFHSPLLRTSCLDCNWYRVIMVLLLPRMLMIWSSCN